VSIHPPSRVCSPFITEASYRGFFALKGGSVFLMSFRELQIYIDDFEEFAYTYKVSVALTIGFENNARWVPQGLYLEFGIV